MAMEKELGFESLYEIPLCEIKQAPQQAVFTVMVNGNITKIYRFEEDAQKAMDDLLDLGVYASYREDKLN